MSLFRHVSRRAAQASGAAAAMSSQTQCADAETLVARHHLHQPLHLTLAEADGAMMDNCDEVCSNPSSLNSDDEFDFLEDLSPPIRSRKNSAIIDVKSECAGSGNGAMSSAVIVEPVDEHHSASALSKSLEVDPLATPPEVSQPERSMALELWDCVPAVVQANAAASEGVSEKVMRASAENLTRSLLNDEDFLERVKREIQKSQREEEEMVALLATSSIEDESSVENEGDKAQGDGDETDWFSNLWDRIKTKVKTGSEFVMSLVQKLMKNILGSETANNAQHSPVTVLIVLIAVAGLVIFTVRSSGPTFIIRRALRV